MKAFPLRSITIQGYPRSLFLSNIILKFLTKGIKQEKINKRYPTGKKDVKWSLFTDDMILYVENPKEVTKKSIRAN